MAIGKTFRFDRIAGHSWKQFAADMNVRPERLYSLMESCTNPSCPLWSRWSRSMKGNMGLRLCMNALSALSAMV